MEKLNTNYWESLLSEFKGQEGERKKEKRATYTFKHIYRSHHHQSVDVMYVCELIKAPKAKITSKE